VFHSQSKRHPKKERKTTSQSKRRRLLSKELKLSSFPAVAAFILTTFHFAPLIELAKPQAPELYRSSSKKRITTVLKKIKFFTP
jgi:hypothetical protein